VKLASSGRASVPNEKTVVQALAAAGVEIATSCEQCVCGTCLTRVLEGEPAHKDMYLTPEEQAANAQFTPCCSRSHSPLLVLDL
jgi:vanillate O-demethylase ferredoxin subunit